jgi:hypothetical protein
VDYKGRYGPLGKYKDAETLFHAARTVLAHFHFIYRGSVPLSLEWKASGKPQGVSGNDKQWDSVAHLKKQISKESELSIRLISFVL